MMTIFEKSASALRALSVFGVLCVLIGCEVKPFEVISPEFEVRKGSAVVSAIVPTFSRGLIQRVELKITTADTSRLRTVTRNMNFPIRGGRLAVGQISDIPIGVRRFTVRAFDTEGVLRYRGQADSIIVFNQTSLITVDVDRIGGVADFIATVDLASLEDTGLDSVGVVGLAVTSVLDVLEIVPDPIHPSLGLLPIFSVRLGDRFVEDLNGLLTRAVTVRQIPTGSRRFVAHLKDLASNQTTALADTVTVVIDTLNTVDAVFRLEPVGDPSVIRAIFTQETLPQDNSVVVVTPVF
jgi:ribosomal protein S28E/S33